MSPVFYSIAIFVYSIANFTPFQFSGLRAPVDVGSRVFLVSLPSRERVHAQIRTIQPWVYAALDAFGYDRIVFEGNW